MSFVTSYAHLELFRVLNKLKEHVLYYNMDLVIFLEDKSAQKEIDAGNYLGMQTNELDPDKWIESFCSTGPKCYSYQTNRGKGFCLKGGSQKQIFI